MTAVAKAGNATARITPLAMPPPKMAPIPASPEETAHGAEAADGGRGCCQYSCRSAEVSCGARGSLGFEEVLVFAQRVAHDREARHSRDGAE
jgi:hypothetical protein